MNVVHELPEENWQSWIAAHPRANIFHTPEMFRVWTQTKGYTPELWAVVQEDTILALMVPVRISLRKGMGEWLTSRAVVYGNVLAAPGMEGTRALECLLVTYKQDAQHRVLFTELRDQVAAEEQDPTLRAFGFTPQAYLNYWIDLRRPVEEIFGAIGPRTRKHIRHAQKAGRVQVKPVEHSAQLPEWYAVLCATYARAGVPLAELSLFQAAFEQLHSREMCKFWLACIDSVPAACSVELLYKQRIYGWYGGMDRVWSKYNPNELLTWHILEWGARNQFECYDFGGAGRADQAYGVRDFKAKFGGQLVNQNRMTCVHSRAALQLTTFGYRLLGRFLFGRAPSTAKF